MDGPSFEGRTRLSASVASGSSTMSSSSMKF